jgi:glycosyltransferase involved in cell wall biosynthesis
MDYRQMLLLPTITVAICTRNRAPDVARCLASLSQVVYPHWDVLVIDQSDEGTTREVVGRFVECLPHLHYAHVPDRGLTRGRNLALRSAEGEILAFIDDDCTVGCGWLRDVAAAFALYPVVPLIFGRVRPVPHDPRRCFIPSHMIAKHRLLRGRAAGGLSRSCGSG